MRKFALFLFLFTLISLCCYASDRPAWIEKGISDTEDLIYGLGMAKFPTYSASLAGSESKALNNAGSKLSRYLQDASSESQLLLDFVKNYTIQITQYVVSSAHIEEVFNDNGAIWTLCSVNKKMIPNAVKAVAEQIIEEKSSQIDEIKQDFVSVMDEFYKKVDAYKKEVSMQISILESEIEKIKPDDFKTVFETYYSHL